MTTITKITSTSKAIRIAAVTSRALLGIVFVVFGLNGFLQFLPVGPVPEGTAGAFMGGLAQSDYFFPFLKGAEVVIGLMLLLNVFAPLALIMLVPINLNIFLFHLFLGPEGLPISILLLVLNFWLAWIYRSSYRTILINKPAI